MNQDVLEWMAEDVAESDECETEDENFNFGDRVRELKKLSPAEVQKLWENDDEDYELRWEMEQEEPKKGIGREFVARHEGNRCTTVYHFGVVE